MKNQSTNQKFKLASIKQIIQPLVITCICLFLFGKLLAQGGDWQVLDQRMECVISSAAKEIVSDNQAMANRYNEFATNALAWDWNIVNQTTGDFDNWIIGAVFENEPEARAWWEGEGLHHFYYDDSNSSINYWDYKMPVIFHDSVAVLKYRGFDNVGVEGTLWWKYDRFVFRTGNITKLTKDALVTNFLNSNMEKMYEKALECHLFDPVVEIDHFEFTDVPEEVYYPCETGPPTVWLYEDGANILESFSDSISVSLIQNDQIVETWNQVCDYGYSSTQATLTVKLHKARQSYEDVKIRVQYKNITAMSTAFDILYPYKARFTEYPEEVSYEETFQLKISVEKLVSSLGTFSGDLHIREMYTGWEAFIPLYSKTISFTAPDAEQYGNLDELWFIVSACADSPPSSDELIIIIEDAVVETTGGFEDVYSFGGEGNDSGTGIAAGEDPTELFITGEFAGSAIFGDQDLLSEGNDDIYIGKWNYLLNKFEWIQKYGSPTENDSPEEVNENHATHELDLLFDSGEVIKIANGEEEIVRPAGSNVVVSRLNKNTGSVEWVTVSSLPGFESESALKSTIESRHFSEDIESDNNGNCFVTGRYYENIVFTGTDGISNWSAEGSSEYRELFLVKFSNSGEVLWGFNAKGNDDVRGRKIIADSQGNVYLVASYDDSVNMDSYEFNDGRGAFIIKFSPSGEILWLLDIKEQCYINGIVLDNEEQNFFITGRAKDNCNFGGMIWENTEPEYTRLFYARITTDGVPVWIKHGGTTSEDESHWPQDMDIDSKNNIYITGYFREGNLSFGQINLVPDNMDSGNNIIFAAAFNEDGDVLWADKAADNPVGYEDGNRDNAKGITIDGKDNCYITGVFRYEAEFGGNNVTGAGENDAFIAKVSGGIITGIDEKIIEKKLDYSTLSQNYPNPFSQITKINYSIAEYGFVSLKVYNILGEEIIELVNKEQFPGFYTIDFESGGLKPGIYFFQLNTKNSRLTNKMILINNYQE